MDEVYEAFDESLRLRLALKTLCSELTATDDDLGRFQGEILVAREVSHENLCRVLDFVEPHTADRIIPCLTMELIEGQSLPAHLDRTRPLSLDAALPLIRQIADGLDVLHDHGIVHRDLKPSNITLTQRRAERFRAVVMDFGLAKPEDGDCGLFESLRLNRAGAPYFMAPELFRQGRPSVASDLSVCSGRAVLAKISRKRREYVWPGGIL
jgi:serine/threonine protein kinase